MWEDITSGQHSDYIEGRVSHSDVYFVSTCDVVEHYQGVERPPGRPDRPLNSGVTEAEAGLAEHLPSADSLTSGRGQLGDENGSHSPQTGPTRRALALTQSTKQPALGRRLALQ